MGTPKAICGGNCLSYIKLERRKPIIMEAIIGLVTAFDIKADVLVSMTLNFIAIVLAITGILNPVIGALVHNAGSVLVIINSAFLLNWRNRKL